MAWILPNSRLSSGFEHVGPILWFNLAPPYSCSAIGISNSEPFAVFVTTFALEGLLTPLARRLALSRNVVNLSTKTRKKHQYPTLTDRP
jgi:hypothetical protein